MGFYSVDFDPLFAVADRDQPIRTHLQFVIQRFHRTIIEQISCLVRFRSPDQRFMGIGEPGAFKIRHRVGFAPDNVVQYPKAFVLDGGADAENIVVAADDPYGAVGLQYPVRLRQPGFSERIVGGECVELVPVIGYGIDSAPIGPVQIAAKLQVIRWVGEHHIDARIGQRAHRFDAVHP